MCFICILIVILLYSFIFSPFTCGSYFDTNDGMCGTSVLCYQQVIKVISLFYIILPFQRNILIDILVWLRKDEFFQAFIGILRRGKYLHILGNQSIES